MPRRSVALLIESSNEYSRGLLNGIADYIHLHENWSVVLTEQQRGAPPPKWLKNWEGDGIIARIESDSIAKALAWKQVPIVDVSAARQLPGIPWVETDDEAIAKLAFRHFIDRGFKNLAFVSDPGFNWSVWRGEHFEKCCDKRGSEFFKFESTPRNAPEYSLTAENERLADWIQSLPRPVGILACYDIKAQQVLDVCRKLDIGVPEEVAVLGVDNDPIICQFSTPPLSSVICNTRRTGFEAASLLDSMMSGEAVSSSAVLVKPLGIETRHSTDTLAIDDPDVATALRYIRTYACEGLKVNEVVRQVALSRRVFEKRFHSILGRTPHQEINRIRIDRIKQLLSETDLPLSVIAQRTGFQHDEYMSVAFKKTVGVPPSHYRTQSRDGA